jgi:hypothetical protein
MGVGADEASDTKVETGSVQGPGDAMSPLAPVDEIGLVAGVDEPSGALAWRILSSPRTFVALAVVAAVILCLAALLPQRPLPGELARSLPFGVAEAVRDLQLDDVLVGWPLLLVGLLMGLNGAGMLLAATLRRAARDVTPGASRQVLMVSATGRLGADLATLRPRLTAALGGGRVVVSEDAGTGRLVASRGFVREGLAVAGLGVLALIGALVVSRGPAIDARLKVVPGSPNLPESTVRDGDLMLLRQLPFGLFCGRPDPQDPGRSVPCRTATSGQAGGPVDVILTPGGQVDVGGFSVSLVTESLRVPRETDAFEFVIRRRAALERLRVEPNKTVELKSGGERITAMHGPDGPLVVLTQQREGKAETVLLLPSSGQGPATGGSAGSLQLEVEHANTLSLKATTTPEAPLTLAGLALLLFGLILAAAVPHLRLDLVAVPGGTLARASSLNRAHQPERAIAILEGHPTPPQSSFIASLWPTLRADLPTQAAAFLALAVGLFIGVQASFSTSALPFAIATLVALGTRAALPLGALTLVAGLGTVPESGLPSVDQLLAMVCAGLALGAVGRWLALDELLRDKPLLSGGLLALMLATLLSLPPVSVQLAGPAGDPLMYGATLVDGPALMQVAWPVPAFIPGARSWFSQLAMVGAWLGALALLAAHVSAWRRPETSALWTSRNAVRAGLVVGGLAIVVGLVGMASLFGGDSIEQEAVRRHLDLLASRDASVLAIAPGTFELRLWSRPFIDGLVVLLGGFLVWRLVPFATREVPVSAESARVGAGGGHALMALGLTALSAFFVARDEGQIAGGALIALAAALLFLGALVVARTATPTAERLSPALLLTRLTLAGAALALVAMWLMPPLFLA